MWIIIPYEKFVNEHLSIFSSPQVAGVGFTEQELKEEEKDNSNNNIDYVKSLYQHSYGTSA
ncbi:MAG: hypothetical protein ACJ72C_09385 [Nitrososphaeraceae archaeon]